MTSNDRTTRTPAERAQEALDRQGRVVARLTEKYERLTDEAARVDDELSAARKRHAYLSQHPDLPASTRSLGDVLAGSAVTE